MRSKHNNKLAVSKRRTPAAHSSDCVVLFGYSFSHRSLVLIASILIGIIALIILTRTAAAPERGAGAEGARGTLSASEEECDLRFETDSEGSPVFSGSTPCRLK